uniref:Uncharacterized protein n=1 Tax=Anguilla anguilla TaxID=7936 RepID=A0A0E9P688_ANGAN
MKNITIIQMCFSQDQRSSNLLRLQSPI